MSGPSEPYPIDPTSSTSPGWEHEYETIFVSYIALIGIVALAWDSTITSTLKRISDVSRVNTTEPASRAYVLAVFGYSIVRTLLLTIAGLTALYLLAQMINIMSEVMPYADRHDMVFVRFVHWISDTSHILRAVEPTGAVMASHATVLGLSCAVAGAMTLFYVTDADLSQPRAMRLKLLYILLVLPVLALVAYIATWFYRMINVKHI